MSRVAIVGAYQTKYSAALADENHQDLAYRTVKGVLEATGLKQQDLEIVINSGSDILDGRGISTYMMVEALGAQLTEETKVAEDGAYSALYAWMRIAAGSYDLALVIAYGKSSESHPHWYHNMNYDPFYGQPLGLDLLNAAALQANAYSQKYGVTEEQAARVVIKNLRNAKNNPFALRKGDYSLEEVMASPYLATPLKELDVYPVTDGAVALRFILENEKDSLGLDFADLQCKEVHAGHLFLAKVTSKDVQLVDHKTGGMRNDIRDARAEKKPLTPEQQKALVGKTKTAALRTEPGKWHDLLVTVQGDELTVSVDGKLAASLRSSGIAHPTKRMLRLSVPHNALVDDVKIWRKH